MIPLRFACLFWWIAASITSIGAIDQRDWHLLVVQIAEALVALVLWFSVDSETDRFRAPTFGPRWVRLALYATTLVSSIAAFLSWQWPLRSAATSLSDVGIILLGIVMIGRFINAEWKRHAAP
jgi:hypothetical protein